MAVAQRPAYEEKPAGRQAREPLWRRRELHLIIGVIVAALTVAFAAVRATNGARAVLDDRLLHAGAGVNAGFVDVESEQLAVVRSISFTPGVATDLAAKDGPALNNLVAPLQANSTVPMVDMVVPDGRVLLAVRSKGAPLPVRTRAGLNALSYAFKHSHGARGGRLSEIVVFHRGGATLVTISPVMSGRKPVGAVLAMTPVANILGRLSQETWANITVYDATGAPLATTGDFVPKPLPEAAARALIEGAAVETRYVYGNEREKVGRLIVDHTANAVLGVSLPDNSDSVGRAVGIYSLIGLICTVVILATFWARIQNAQRLE
ncbi:MAG TPA: hypothetical protein VKR79_06125 [Gaiellaceae bacterium]|nr:hypothetical protein [Gaiellaceae bacterium]